MDIQKVMAIGAHADYIEVSCGGTLLKCRDNKYEIVYVMTTNNMSGNVAELQDNGTVKNWSEAPLEIMLRVQGCRNLYLGKSSSDPRFGLYSAVLQPFTC